MRFALGTTTVDLDGHLVEGANGVVSLTPIETALLHRLLDAAGAPVPRDVLLADVWNYAAGVKTRTLTVTVHRLRTKIEPNPSDPKHLLTRRGEGIQLCDAVELRQEFVADEAVLFGRDEALASAREKMGSTGLLTVCGPVGVGKTALARVLMSSGGWVDVDGVDRPEVVYARLLRDTPHRGNVKLETVLEWLRGQPRLVLDGLHPGLLGNDLERLAAVTQVIVTSSGPQQLAIEQVLRLEPFDRTQTRALLAAELERQGFSTPVEVQNQVADQLDGLPQEILVAAPLVGLFGLEAVPGVRESLWPALRASVERLDEASLDFASRLAVFEGSFDLAAALAITSTSQWVAASTVQLLMRRGLLTRSGTTFRVLRSLREQLTVPAEATHKLLVFCAELCEGSMRDDGARLVRHADDVVKTAEFPGQHVAGIALSVFDLMYLEGPKSRYHPLLETLATHGDRQAEHLAWMAQSDDFMRLSADKTQRLIERAEAGDALAAVTGFITEVAFPTTGRTMNQWVDLVLAGEMSMGFMGRFLPAILAYSPDPRVESVMARVIAGCAEQGWTVMEQYARGTQATCWIVQGKADLVLQQAVPEGSRLVSRRARLTRVAAALVLNSPERALLECEEADAIPYHHPMETMVLRAMALLLSGRSLEILDFEPPPSNSIQTAAWSVLTHWPEPVKVEHEVVAALLEERPLPEGVLPGRLAISLQATLKHLRAQTGR